MKQCYKFSLFVLCCLTAISNSYGQVEFSGLAGPAFHYARVKQSTDPDQKPVIHGINSGYAATLEANVPMQHGFRLKAGLRFMNRNITFKQQHDNTDYSLQNTWFLKGFALETPVHITYPIIDRRFQLALGAGASVVKNWIHYSYSGISWSRSNSSGNYAGNYVGLDETTNYEPEKNGLSVAGELSAEITPSAYPRFSLNFVWHQDLLKKMGRVTYENEYVTHAGSIPVVRSKGSFGIENPGYWMVQLKYTFAGKPKEKEEEREILDFEDDDSN